MTRAINAKVYDQNVILEGEQSHIDNYYDPKLISQKRRIKIIMQLLEAKEGDKILDIGSGVGTFAYASAKTGSMAFGLDYSHESMKMAVHLAEKFNTQDRSFFITASALELPYKDASFDKIVCADFIEHITNEEKIKLLSEIKRVLKPAGTGVIFTPSLQREKIGESRYRLKHLLFKTEIPVNDLHHGLISKAEFDKILKAQEFAFKFSYGDTTRPYLARIPLINKFLALNLIWIIRKK